jgi:hypothetical protein
MSDNNLSIGITVESTQATASLGKIQSELRETRKEWRALSDEARKGTPGAEEKLLATSRAIQGLERQQRDLLRTTRGVTAANQEASLSFAEMGKQVGQFAKVSGLGIAGIKALRGGFIALIAAEVIRGLTAVTEKITDLSNLSKELTLPTAEIQQFTRAVQDAGGAAADAEGMLKKLTEPFDAEKKLAMMNFWQTSKEDLAALAKPASEFAKALEKLGINLANIGSKAQLVDAVTQALARMAASGNITEANRLSVELLGKNWAQAGEALQNYNRALQAGKQAEGTGPGSPAAIEAAKNYTIAVSELGRQWDIFTARLAVTGATATAVHALTGLVTVLDGLVIFFGINVPNAVQYTRDALQALSNYLEETFNSTVGTVAQAFKDAWDGAVSFVVDKINTLIGWYDAAIAKAQELLSYVGLGGGGNTDAGGGGEITPGGASGGYVRGRGTGTSDSILARLSNGEFVLNAASVRRLGVGFLQGLNTFAMGGLVGPPPISFAAGGLVPAAAGSGRAVASFHFENGRSFRLSGPADVVDAMVSEAHAQQVRSAGVKPSWYAARPSGR